MKKPSRDPGTAIKHRLRSDVNFGCPVRFADGTGCGSPILTFHHFDPPWAGNNTHDPEGMIALCPTHHTQADGGAWTKEQLRSFKQFPYVDSAIRVQLPWQPETLVMKVGPSLVVGSGSPMRLDERPVMHFAPRTIEALGVRTVQFDSDVRDQSGAVWLRIQDSWFDLRLADTTNLVFTPQTKTFLATHSDGVQLSMKWRQMPAEAVRPWLLSFMTKEATAISAADSLESAGALDSDGRITIVEFEGRFRSKHVSVDVRGNKMKFRSHIPGLAEEFEWHSWVVNSVNRATIKLKNGPVFFSLG